MAILKKLKEALDRAGVAYEVQEHPAAYTAPEIAAVQHVPGREMAKVVVLFVDGRPAMAVVPANGRIDLERARIGLGAGAVTLATESDLAGLFPDCELGGMPPLGSLFGVPVLVDPSLDADVALSFNAGNHRECVRMRYEDWKRLANPRTVGLVEELAAR